MSRSVFRAIDVGMKCFAKSIIPALAFACASAYAEIPDAPDAPPPGEATPKSLNEALEKLNLPGIKINVEEWSVDVDSTVALRGGLLELVACMKDTKEHESIIAVEAKASHIHAALLLLGAEPGNPAIRKIVGDGPDSRFIDKPPRGGKIDVYLVLDTDDGKKEYPVTEFIQQAREDFDHTGNPVEHDDEPESFPSHSFLFTGSVLVEREEGQPRQYIADYSGNVISLVTFGDEMMSKPGFHDDSNYALMWEVRNDKLPALDEPVILRLKPQRGDGAEVGTGGVEAAEGGLDADDGE